MYMQTDYNCNLHVLVFIFCSFFERGGRAIDKAGFTTSFRAYINMSSSSSSSSPTLQVAATNGGIRCMCQCPSCGRDNSARCIGPNICCHRNKFCEFDSETCHKENFVPTPCGLPAWPTCGAPQAQSLCVTSQLCCNDGQLAVWCSGNALVSINAVALHRARLVLGWVTAFEHVNRLVT